MIKFQIEKYKQIKDDIQPLIVKHYEEIASDKDIIKLNPNYKFFEEACKANALTIVTARDDGKLIGYAVFIIQYSLHYHPLVVAHNDLFFLEKSYRKGTVGAKLLSESEKALTKRGVNQVLMRTKVYANFGPLLERKGYQETEIVYRKNIQELK